MDLDRDLPGVLCITTGYCCDVTLYRRTVGRMIDLSIVRHTPHRMICGEYAVPYSSFLSHSLDAPRDPPLRFAAIVVHDRE